MLSIYPKEKTCLSKPLAIQASLQLQFTSHDQIPFKC